VKKTNKRFGGWLPKTTLFSSLNADVKVVRYLISRLKAMPPFLSWIFRLTNSGALCLAVAVAVAVGIIIFNSVWLYAWLWLSVSSFFI